MKKLCFCSAIYACEIYLLDRIDRVFYYEAYIWSSYWCSHFSICLQKTTTLNFQLSRERLVCCLIISAINQSNIYLAITGLRKIHLSLLPGATFLIVINKMIRNRYFSMAFAPVCFSCPAYFTMKVSFENGTTSALACWEDRKKWELSSAPDPHHHASTKPWFLLPPERGWHIQRALPSAPRHPPAPGFGRRPPSA